MSEDQLAITEPKPISITAGASLSEVIKRASLIKQVLTQIMQPGQHYGKIPGVDREVLLKPGAEKLCSLFNLGSEVDIKQIDLPEGHREYLITCTIKHYPTGAVVGQGVGSCSTMESKYRYRNVADYEVTDEDIPADARERKQEYRKRGYGMKRVDGQWVWVKYGDAAKTENPDLADVYNTVLKMGKKRALVDAVLTATGASDIFTQDVEERADVEPRVREKAVRPEERQYEMDSEEKVYKKNVEARGIWHTSVLHVEQEPKGRFWIVTVDDMEHPTVYTKDKAMAVKAAQWLEGDPVDIQVESGGRAGSWVLVDVPERPEGAAIIEESLEEEFARKEAK